MSKVEIDASVLAELQARVATLEARNAIEDLATAYAVACDEHDIPRLASLFTADAQFDSPSGAMVADGREAIKNMFIEFFKIRGAAYHWTHDHVVKVQSADQATGVVLSHAETTPNQVVSLSAMKYEDDYQRVDGQWLFSKRVIKFLYYVPADQYLNALNQSERFTVLGERRLADYPENLPSWQAFNAEHGD